MIPVDLTAIIEKGLADGHRPHDGLLHASGDLVGSLRHTQLRFVNAPAVERDLVSDIRLHTGTMWHSYLGSLLVRGGIPVLQEVSVTPWMPTGWSGTADWLFWHPEHEAFVLGDLKTAKGESIEWTERGGMKNEHLHQLSAYWHALVAAGFPMLDVMAILYLPMNAVMGEDIRPLIVEAKPLDEDYMMTLMTERYEVCKEYAGSIYPEGAKDPTDPGCYISDKLAPPQDRVQKLFWNKAVSGWDVKLVPHWSAQFCPFPDELCDCSATGSTKVGHWKFNLERDLEWEPRKGYDVEPTVEPSLSEVRRRIK